MCRLSSQKRDRLSLTSHRSSFRGPRKLCSTITEIPAMLKPSHSKEGNGRMDLATFKKRRLEALANSPVYRTFCWDCRQPDFSCYCAWLKPFDPGIQFVILTHPVEYFRRIATGRMSHLS